VDQSRDRPNRQLAVLVSGWSSQPTEVCANVIVRRFRASDAMWNVGDLETPELHCCEMNIYDWSLDDDGAFFLDWYSPDLKASFVWVLVSDGCHENEEF
jgi:hypothetical protein